MNKNCMNSVVWAESYYWNCGSIIYLDSFLSRQPSGPIVILLSCQSRAEVQTWFSRATQIQHIGTIHTTSGFLSGRLHSIKCYSVVCFYLRLLLTETYKSYYLFLFSRISRLKRASPCDTNWDNERLNDITGFSTRKPLGKPHTSG